MSNTGENEQHGSEPKEPKFRTSSEPMQQSSEPLAVYGSVQQASDLLGISERAVLKRIQAGTLAAERDGKHWKVVLPHGSEPTQPEFRTSSEPKLQSSEPQAGEYASSAEPTQNPMQALAEHQAQEIDFLRYELAAQREKHASEIARRDVAEAEYRRLLLADRQQIAQLRQQLAIAPASVQAEHRTPDTEATMPNAQRPTPSGEPQSEPIADAVQHAAQGGKPGADGESDGQKVQKAESGQGKRTEPEPRHWWKWWRREHKL